MEKYIVCEFPINMLVNYTHWKILYKVDSYSDYIPKTKQNYIFSLVLLQSYQNFVYVML